MSDGGLFVFNNHRNYQSLTYRMLRAADVMRRNLPACPTRRRGSYRSGWFAIQGEISRWHRSWNGSADVPTYQLGAGIERITTKVKALASLSNNLLYVSSN